jgi:SAM-dependent methyltransferase
MSSPAGRRRTIPLANKNEIENAAGAYNQASAQYAAYADGDPQHLFSFRGEHAFSDQHVWSVLDTKLRELRKTGVTSLSVLDAGCGPGTWLRRVVWRAHLLGFAKIRARGFDVAEEQIRIAREACQDMKALSGLTLSFGVADLERPLPDPGGSIDITLCLYSVLSHLPTASFRRVVAEFARVTRGQLITSVRAIGSKPTVSTDSTGSARRFCLDHDTDCCEVEFSNGIRMALRFHLFTGSELRDIFSSAFEVEDLCGLDIFHSRFTPDPRWNPASSAPDARLRNVLDQLEQRYARNPCFIDRATHLLLVARSRRRSLPFH